MEEHNKDKMPGTGTEPSAVNGQRSEASEPEKTAGAGDSDAAVKKTRKTKAQKDLSIEEAFAQLQKILAKMEDEKTTLEDSFASYEKGMQLLQYCNDRIDRVEKKVQKMAEDGTTTDFN